MTMQQERNVYIDYLRILASFAVIVLHMAAQNWYTVPCESFEWKVFNFYDSIVRWSVPVFVMISGALFLNRRYTIKKIYTQNIVRIIAAFVVWSSVYAVVFNTNGSEKTMLYDAISGPFHFWFLPMIVGIYMCVPILYKIIEDRKIVIYFLVLSFIFCFLLPQIFLLMVDYGNDFWSSIAWSARYTLTNAQFRMLGGYIFYFIAGYYLSNCSWNKRERLVIYVLGVIGHILTILLTDIASIINQSPIGTYYDPFTVNVMLECLAIFVWFKYNMNNISRESIKKIVCYISKCSFGVYIVHILVIDKFCKYAEIDTLSFNPIVSVPVISLVVFAISLFISAILNKIPFVKKYFV